MVREGWWVMKILCAKYARNAGNAFPTIIGGKDKRSDEAPKIATQRIYSASLPASHKSHERAQPGRNVAHGRLDL